MTDPEKSGASADEAGSEGTPAQDETRSTGAEDTGAVASSSETESEAASGTASETAASSGGSGSESTQKLSAETGSDGEETEKVATSSAETEQTAQEDGEKPTKNRGKLLGVLLGVTSSLLVIVVALGLVAMFVYPGYAGPGSPDKTAQDTATALASKDPAQLEQVSCKSPEGKPTTQIPPQAMQMIAAAQSTAPPQVVLDTEAHAPMNLTLTAQGQTQTLPSIAVLGVSQHKWCLKGLAQQQQGGQQ